MDIDTNFAQCFTDTYTEAKKVNEAIAVIETAWALGLLTKPDENHVLVAMVDDDGNDLGWEKYSMLDAAISLKNDPDGMQTVKDAIELCTKTSNYLAYNIVWDVDDNDTSSDGDFFFAPRDRMAVYVPPKYSSEEEISEYISDKISDLSGFCHCGFKFAEISGIKFPV